MALRKPSDLFNKKETSGVFESPEISSHITESYDKFRNNFDKVNELSEKVEVLSKELSEKLTKSDLENAMLSQLMILDENFKSLQNQVKGLNKQDLKDFKETVSNLSEIVDNLVETELPKYKKQITKNELYVGEQVNQLQGIVETNISGIREEIDEKFDNIADVVDNNIEYFNKKLEETSTQVKKTTETYTNISNILENKVSQENEKFEEYSELIENLSQAFEQLSGALKEELTVSSQLTEEKFEDYRKQFETISSNLKASVDVRLEDYHKEILDIKADVVIFEKHIKNVDKYLQEHHQELIELKEEVFSEIEKLPVGNLQENIERLEKKIDYIKETYSKIEPEVVVKEVIKEGLLNEPSETDNSDPLTPLNQNFVTLDQLQGHYRLFINRIQQQLSTIGGGGETRLKYLDDIVGIATDPSAYNGKFLKYDHSIGKFEFTNITGGTQNLNTTLGYGNTSSLGMSVGFTTITGVGNTALTVNGDVRIVGILTIGTGTLTLDGTNNNIQVGAGVTITESGSASYSGILTAASFSGSGANLTNLNATNLTSGIVPAARITDTSALTVAGDLYVTGNISFGGTTTQLNTQQLQIVDPDIVLGIGTSFSPTDNTANHGGIAIASTEGSPLVNLNIVPGETNPTTYKKIMWFKGNTIGAGLTDAWLFNYAVGIGSTQVPNGVRLAAGAVQFTERDLAVVRGVNASGIVTGSTFRPSTGFIQAADGTNSLYIYSGTGNVAFQGTIGASQVNNASGYKALDFGVTTTPSVNITNNLIVNGNSLYVDATNNRVGIATTNPIHPFQVGTAGTTTFVVTGIGSVGIGTTVPTSALTVNGDINLIDTNQFTTTVQVATATTNRTITFPDATGTVALVAGSSGQLIFNLLGVQTGSSNLTYTDGGGLILTNPMRIAPASAGIALSVVPTSTGSAGLFSGTTSVDMVRITQLGTGNALVVEDSANPDATPFVVGAAGSVGIGTNNPTSLLHVLGDASVSGLVTTNNLYVAGIGTFLSSGLKVRNPANTFEYTIAGGAILNNYTLTLPVVDVNTTLAATGISAQTFTGSNTFSASFTLSTNTSNINLGNSQTSGNWTAGGASQTGTMTLGQSTVSQTTNIQAGASGVGTTKTINLGTGGLSGSNTQINIGPTAGVGTVVINSGTNLGIGTTNPPDSLTVLGRVQIQQDSGSNSRLIFRARPGNSFRWNIDNDGGTNNFRIFREDDVTTANGFVAVNVNSTGGTVISGVTTVGLANTSTPPSNSQMSFELTSDTNLRIKVRGTDGVLRSANITLA